MKNILLLIFAIYSFNLSSQELKRKNKISIKYRFNKTFDNSTGNFIEKNGVALGLEYSYHINTIKTSLFIDYNYNVLLLNIFHLFNYNKYTLIDKSNHTFLIGADKVLYNKRGFVFSLKPFVGYRIIDESFLKKHPYFYEGFFEYIKTNNFGVGVGFSVSYHLTELFSLGFNGNYGYFFYTKFNKRYKHVNDNVYYNPNLIFFSLSMGFSF